MIQISQDEKIEQAFKENQQKKGENNHQPRNRYWIIGILYIIQSIGLNLSSTLVLTYNKIPQYSILSLFQLARFGFMIKFLIAPFIEKYTSLSYGRRKTWIVLGNFCFAISCLILSRYCSDEMVMIAIVLTFFMTTSLVIQDISLDALTLKQITSPETASYVQTSALSIGQIIGISVFLKLVSRDFGIRLGLQDKLISVSTFLMVITVFGILIAIFFHFFFSEPYIQSQIRESQQDRSLLQTFKVYKVFFKSNRRQFRLSVLFLIISQGILFYAYSYQFQLYKKGHSKQNIKLFQNLAIIPSLICSYFFIKLDSDPYKLLFIGVTTRFLLYVVGFIIQPQSYYGLLFYVAIDAILSNNCFVSQLICINSLRLTPYTAMVICMLSSIRNMGDTNSLHLWIIGKIGFNMSCYIGFVIQLIIFFFLNQIMDWIKEGEDIQFQLESE